MPAIRRSDSLQTAAPLAAPLAVPAGIIPPRVALGCGKAVAVVFASLITAIALLTVTLVLLPANSFAARAAGVPATQAPGQQSEAPLNGFFFPSGPDGTALEAPQLDSDVRINVSGMIARVAVRQRFTNPSDSWQEGIYVFPLPEKSAVDRLVMTVGGRTITGEILEKEQAKRAYDAAAAAGQRASLLSSERPNVFVTSLANIGPGEEIIIDIEYQDSAIYSDGTFSLRFPMVVAPRYTPREEAPSERPQTVDESSPSPIRARPTRASFVGDDRDLFGPVGTRVNPVTLTVRLDPGAPLDNLTSLYHPVDIEALDDRRKVITLQEGSVPANKDFVLEWRLASAGAPQAAVFVEDYEGDSYVMMMVTPPAGEPHPESLDRLKHAPAMVPFPPRDIVFVVDTSGSMHGASLEQARAALSLAISRLQPQDRFNVIRFNNETYSLFDDIVPVTADSLRRAQAYVNALESDGGTEMRSALLRALKMNAEAEIISKHADDRLQQVVFLTDGAVGNEAELFKLIAEKLESSRLFTVGIGAAPNSYFMRKAAEAGRGTFTYIGDPNEVAEKMSALLRKLERPALTGISLGWPGSAGKKIESYPSIVPDLYEGEPVVVISRIQEVEVADLSGKVLISGRQGTEDWQRRAALADSKGAEGIAALWARSKFGEITDGLFLGRDPVAVRLDALEVALKHQLVTRYTSLVAIDDQPVRPAGEPLESQEVPREMPEGWSREKVFGTGGSTEAGIPGTLSPVPDAMPVRKLPISIAAMAPSAQGNAVQLPQTATPAMLNAMIGAALLILGLLVFAGIGLSRRGREDHA